MQYLNRRSRRDSLLPISTGGRARQQTQERPDALTAVAPHGLHLIIQPAHVIMDHAEKDIISPDIIGCLARSLIGAENTPHFGFDGRQEGRREGFELVSHVFIRLMEIKIVFRRPKKTSGEA
jgi:hypothetical protein